MHRSLLIFIFLFIMSSDCYGAGTGTVVDPYTTVAELASATCNNTIYLKNGTYASYDLTLAQACTVSTPLIIKCSNGSVESKGSCEWHGGTANISGTYITLDGFYVWSDVTGQIPLEINGGSHNTITDCHFGGYDNANGLTIGRTTSNNQYNLVTRCLFDTAGIAWGGYVTRIRYSSPNAYTGNTHNIITKNVYYSLQGGAPILQMGDGSSLSDNEQSYNEFTYNLIQNCNSSCNVVELMEIKVGAATISYNTFKESCGHISLRVGDNNVVNGNFMTFTSNDGGSAYPGIRISGAGHKILNNYLQGYQSGCVTGDVSSMAISAHWGGVTCASSGATQVSNVLIANNTIKDTCFGYTMFQHDVNCTLAPTGVTYVNNLGESNVTSSSRALFGGGDFSGTGNTWTTNQGHTSAGQDLKNAGITSGVTDSGSFELTLQKTGLPVNWYYPSVYTTGTYNSNVLTDIQGQTRGNPPDIGCDESGGTDTLIAVGPTWTGGYTIFAGEALSPNSKPVPPQGLRITE